MPAHKLPGNQAAINKAEYNRRWRAANRERVRECEKARRLANPEPFKAAKAKYLASNKEKTLAYARDRWKERGDELRAKLRESGKNAEYTRRYREKNLEKSRQMTQAWKDANPERRQETNRLWTQANLEKHRTYQHNRRARKIENGGKLSPDLAARLYQLQRGLCACCGKKLGQSFDMDHIVPLVLGGSNTDDNMQLLTPSCNRRKGAKPPIEYMQSKGKLL